jgi:hypothetical protein
MTERRALDLRIVGTELPGGDGVLVGIQRGKEVIERVSADTDKAIWDLDLELRPGRDGAPEVRGPWVHGGPGDRFLYLSWGTLDADGAFAMFSRAKIWPAQAGAAALEEAAAAGNRLEAHVSLTDSDGGPLCGGLRGDSVSWRVA